MQGSDAEVWVGLDHLHLEPELDGDVAGEGDAAGDRLSNEAVPKVDSAQSRGREPEYAVKWFGTLSAAKWYGTHAHELQGAVFAALVVHDEHAWRWQETCPTWPGTGSR